MGWLTQDNTRVCVPVPNVEVPWQEGSNGLGEANKQIVEGLLGDSPNCWAFLFFFSSVNLFGSHLQQSLSV